VTSAGTPDAGWLRAVHAVVPAVVRAERPDMIVSQHGCDTHVLDPLAHLLVTVDAQRAAAALVHSLAHEHAGGRWLALGGGGYEVIDVVPRSWAHLVALAAHADIDPDSDVPQGWREYVLRRFGRLPPMRMTDGGDGSFERWEDGYDPADPVDRAVMATRRAAFPHLGLDPWQD
jgi:acetoin utilization protein AcuC